MKLHIAIVSVFAGLIVFCMACQKKDPLAYDQPAMVYIYKNALDPNKDSLSYSFATKSSTLEKDTIKIPLRIMGMASAMDREVKVNVLKDSSTAVDGRDFQILPAIIAANSYTGYIPVLVKRNSVLKTSEVRLKMEIAASKDFNPGPNTAAANPRAGSGTKYLVKLNDFLSKPGNWDTQLLGYFGTYSQAKYAFIIRVTGRSEFPAGVSDNALSPSELNYYKMVCRNALNDYIEANGPLYDEFDIAVTI